MTVSAQQTVATFGLVVSVLDYGQEHGCEERVAMVVRGLLVVVVVAVCKSWFACRVFVSCDQRHSSRVMVMVVVVVMMVVVVAGRLAATTRRRRRRRQSLVAEVVDRRLGRRDRPWNRSE